MLLLVWGAKVRCGPERYGEWTSWRGQGRDNSHQGRDNSLERGRDSAFAQWVGGRGRLQGSRVMV